MKATKLQHVIRNFNPRRPLSGQDLHFWFVTRRRSPRLRVRNYLESQPDKAVKLLLVGHRGSGKSTELNKLVEDLGSGFEVIYVDVLGTTGQTTPGYEDLMLAISTTVTRALIDRKLVSKQPGERLRESWQNLRDWWQQSISGLEIPSGQSEVTTYAQLSTLLGEISVGVAESSFSREQIVDQINRRMPELIRFLNAAIDEAHGRMSGTKRLLLIVEGSDKVDLNAARNIFRDHAPTITSPNAAMIYTFPLALRYSNDFNIVRRSFDDCHFLPNFAPHKRDGTDDDEGLAALRKLVLSRMEADLINVDALEQVVRSSGGLPMDLVKLVQNSVLYALERAPDAAYIDAEDVANAVRDLRADLSAPLTQEDWSILVEKRRTRRLTNDADVQKLLFSGALIEYANNVPWCDVHPALWDVLHYYDENEL